MPITVPPPSAAPPSASACRATKRYASGDGGARGEVGGPPAQVETVEVLVLHEDFDLTLLFDDGERLGAIEEGRFHDEDADLQVTLEGIDVFRIPADDLGDLLRARGHRVEEEDLFVVRDLDMIFDNASSFEYPTDDEGFPLYFDYILLATDTGHV